LADIISPFKLAESRLAEIREAGASIHLTLPTGIDEIKLPEPEYGETVIGTMTPEEAELFLTSYQLQLDIEDMSRNAVADLMSRVGQQIRSSDRQRSLVDSLSPASIEFEDEATEKKFTRMQQLQIHVHAMLFFQIGERLDVHHYRLGVRSKGRIVKTTKRLQANPHPEH
jgi:hypothetical protein